MASIQSDILRGAHPAAIMHNHGLSVAQLQVYVCALAVVLRRAKTPAVLPPVREATPQEWRRRFRAMSHLGV